MKPNPPSTSSPKGKKLLDRLCDQLRIKHYSLRTEKTYVAWVRRFILFHTQLLQNGYDIRTSQELLGHKDVKTAMIYTHVLQRGAGAVKSPPDG